MKKIAAVLAGTVLVVTFGSVTSAQAATPKKELLSYLCIEHGPLGQGSLIILPAGEICIPWI